jgi:3-oxoacyl-[acyl-carrier protein] reductase
MTTDLTGQVAVVTGAGRGIGRALGARLAREGMKVGLVSRTGAEVESLRDEITAAGGQAVAAAVDVADRAGVEAFVAQVQRKLGPVDLLVNNAARSAVWDGTKLWESDPDDWWSRIETNLRGPMLFASAVLPGMVERGHGYVLAMNSLGGAAALPSTDGAYPVSKSALFRLTDQLASQLKDTGVVAMDLSPGLVKTSANDGGGLPDSAFTPVERICDLVVTVARGELDDFSGRFLHAQDDLDELKSRREEITARDGRVLRIVPGWDDDSRMKPYW